MKAAITLLLLAFLSWANAEVVTLNFTGNPNQLIEIQKSADLLEWVWAASGTTNQTGGYVLTTPLQNQNSSSAPSDMTSFGGICLMITLAGLIGLILATGLAILNAAVTRLSPGGDKLPWKAAIAVHIGLGIATLATAMLVGAMVVILLYRTHEPTACYWLGIPSAAFPWMVLITLLFIQIRFGPLPKWHERLDDITGPSK